jgi:hypothetical protein
VLVKLVNPKIVTGQSSTYLDVYTVNVEMKMTPRWLCCLCILLVNLHVVTCRRNYRLLSGSPLSGLAECYSPFTDRVVKYDMKSEAIWGFGSHGNGLKNTKIGATLSISTSVEYEDGVVIWIHNLTLSDLHLDKVFSGSENLTEVRHPSTNITVSVLLIQKKCDGIDEMIYSDGLESSSLNFMQGLAAIIPFASPVEGSPMQYSIRHGRGWHGPFDSHHSVRRWRNDEGVANFEIRSRVVVHGGDLKLHDGTILKRVRSESTTGIASFEMDLLRKIKIITQTALERLDQSEGQPLVPEFDEDLQVRARGTTLIVFKSMSEGRFYLSHRMVDRKLLSVSGLKQTLMFSSFTTIPSLDEICNGMQKKSCLDVLINACLKIETFSSQTEGSTPAARIDSKGRVTDLVSFLRALKGGDLHELTAPFLQIAPDIGIEVCGNRTQVVVHCLSILASSDGQVILADFVTHLFATPGNNAEQCLVKTLIQISRLKNPTEYLFNSILKIAKFFGESNAFEDTASTAFLTLTSLGSQATSSIKSTVISLLVQKFQHALQQDSRVQLIIERMTSRAAHHFESIHAEMKLQLMGKVRNLQGLALNEEWYHLDAAEREHWTQETIRWAAQQV